MRHRDVETIGSTEVVFVLWLVSEVGKDELLPVEVVACGLFQVRCVSRYGWVAGLVSKTQNEN